MCAKRVTNRAFNPLSYGFCNNGFLPTPLCPTPSLNVSMNVMKSVKIDEMIATQINVISSVKTTDPFYKSWPSSFIPGPTPLTS